MAGTGIGPAVTPLLNGAARGEVVKEGELRRERERLQAKKELEKLQKEGADQKGADRKGADQQLPQQFPIPWALTILIVWILFSAALFCIWETEWGYMTSIYFFFVSISTVGLGDLVPTNPDMMVGGIYVGAH